MTRKLIIILTLVLSNSFLMAQEHGTPMSCAIKGKIVCVCNDMSEDENSKCSNYHCKAKVEILEVMRCGSSVTQILSPGDTVTMNFAYTLHKTKKLFPDMEKRYPGLKRKKVFTADAEQMLIPGGAVEFMVYDYSLK